MPKICVNRCDLWLKTLKDLLDAVGFVFPDDHDRAAEAVGDRAEPAVEADVFFGAAFDRGR